MKNPIQNFKSLVFGLALLAVSGCGVAVDPLRAISQETFPKLSNFTSSTAVLSGGGVLATRFTAATPYWDINAGVGIFGGSFLSPAEGTVTQIGTTTVNGSGQANFVTIAHSSRLATKFYGLQQIVVRTGDYVGQGQSIGFFITGGSIFRFQVLLDGNPVCPLSFMDSNLLTQFAYATFGQAACQ